MQTKMTNINQTKPRTKLNYIKIKGTLFIFYTYIHLFIYIVRYQFFTLLICYTGRRRKDTQIYGIECS